MKSHHDKDRFVMLTKNVEGYELTVADQSIHRQGFYEVTPIINFNIGYCTGTRREILQSIIEGAEMALMKLELES